MNIFLRQEVDRMDRVIKVVRSTLVDLQLAIQGTIIMNETLRDALDNLFDAKIPVVWQKVCMAFHQRMMKGKYLDLLGFHNAWVLVQ